MSRWFETVDEANAEIRRLDRKLLDALRQLKEQRALSASAPDLLDMLLWTSTTLQTVCQQSEDVSEDDEIKAMGRLRSIRDILYAANAAIAKAQGR